MDSFETFPEQPEAKRLLRRARRGRARARVPLPRPTRRRQAAGGAAFAAELIGSQDRVLRHAHPDVYPLEPIGDQIRIGDIRELRHDLHMRPFEAQRRVYLIYEADTMNEDAADALLKDYRGAAALRGDGARRERPRPDLETIRSRCQLVPFRRLSSARCATRSRGHRDSSPKR